MAGKKPGTNASGDTVLFDVIYEDGTQLSNRRVPAGMLGGLDKDEPAIAHIEAEDRRIGHPHVGERDARVVGRHVERPEVLLDLEAG